MWQRIAIEGGWLAFDGSRGIPSTSYPSSTDPEIIDRIVDLLNHAEKTLSASTPQIQIRQTGKEATDGTRTG